MISYTDFVLWIALAVGTVAKIGSDRETNRTLAVLLGIQPHRPIADAEWFIIFTFGVFLLIRAATRQKKGNGNG
jgi:hypothetical protein